MGVFIRILSECYLRGEYILIFVCLGTKRFSFNRLLKEIDKLVKEGKVKEVFAQIGQSTYTPQHFKFKRFITAEEYDTQVKKSDLIITHGGTGAIVKALKADKQIIAIPRLEKYGEHSDDHQLQIVDFFESNGYIRRVDYTKNLESTINNIQISPITKSFNGKGNIVDIIDEFINYN